jgi:hypothetical protein
MGMAALLMPRTAFDREATQEICLAESGAIPPLDPATLTVPGFVAKLAAKVAVSKQAARIRLETCGYVQSSR